MNRAVLIILSLCLCAVLFATANAQRNKLADLRVEHARLSGRVAELSKSALSTPEIIGKAEPSIELLRLRAEVARLTNRKRELAAALESDRAQRQAAGTTAGAPGGIVLPPGYLRKSEAKFSGYATPEATLQSWLWAMQNRDAANFMRAYTPTLAGRIQAQIQGQTPAEDIFKNAAVLPGLNVVGRETSSAEEISLRVEVIPGAKETSGELRFKLIDGEWKLASLL